ncbi:MAG: hypothetical protein Q7K65_03530 [Candidatus Buchananbacteria bacterium]|nr:hypothetical protein [Candidatus Buchananbacteria bacterium]
MSSGLVALICAVVGAAPLLIGAEFVITAVMAVIYFIIGWLIIYLGAPSTVYPLFGGPGLLIFVWWICSAIVDLVSSDTRDYRTGRSTPPLVWVLVVLAFITYIGAVIFNSGVFKASGYASLIGQPEEHIWTQDIQPKDPKHMLMGSRENALYQADKALGQAGAIGSQFQVDVGHVTLQKIHDQWFYVVPLEYRSFSVYCSVDDGIPAYIQVSAEDPNRQAQLVELKEKMKYAPSSYFGTYLKRHMRYNGFLDSDMYEYLFEIDEEGNPWWVVPIFKPEFGWWGEKLTMVAQVNPATGEITEVPLEEIPAWMDRVFPGELAQKYLTWHGMYSQGWLNSWWGKNELTIAQSPILIYGADSEPYWVTGITSNNNNDNSLVALAYTDARTGKPVIYKASGGLTEDAILGAVNNNEKIKFRQLHGVNPQLYNCYGTMASVVPLLNGSHIFQGVAIVDMMNPQKMAVGDNQEQALRQYQRLLDKNGQQIALDNSRAVESLDGKVVRIGYDFGSGVYYLMLEESLGHLFTLDATEHPELPLTQPGDDVHLEYENSGEKVMPVIGFSNLAIPLLDGTTNEQAVKEQADERRDQEKARNLAPTIQEKIKDQVEDMTPEELQQFEKKLEK